MFIVGRAATQRAASTYIQARIQNIAGLKGAIMKAAPKHQIHLLFLTAILALTGCIGQRPPAISTTQDDSNTNFSLYVSNQSFSLKRIDIHVEVDEAKVVSQQFSVGTQHNYVEFRLFLEEGPHTIRIWSDKAGVELSKTFTLNGDEDTGVISFWYKPNVTEKCFHFRTFKGPFYIL